MAIVAPAFEVQQPRIPHKRDVPAPDELPGEVQIRETAAVVERVQAEPVTFSPCRWQHGQAFRHTHVRFHTSWSTLP